MKRAVLVPLILGLAFLVCGGSLARGEDLSGDLEKARALLDKEKPKEAMAAFKEVVEKANALLEKDPRDAGTAYILGRAHFYMEQDDEALKAFRLAARLDPKNGEPRFYSGLIHMYGGRYGEGEKEFRAATETDPKVAKYWFELGRALNRQKQKKSALAAFRKAIELEPGHTKALFYAAGVLTGMERPKETLPLYLEILKKEPENIDALYNAGQTEQTLGKHKDSWKHFREVVRLSPTDWRARAKVIQCCQALGKMKERDIERAKLMRLRAKGKVKELKKASCYVRDQFSESGKRVMTLEHFELVGDRARKYVFVVKGEKSKKKEYEISLGSYDVTHEIAQAGGLVKEGDRYFHLDGYFPGGLHRTYLFFNAEPTYDVVRDKVLLILRGKLRAISSSRTGK